MPDKPDDMIRPGLAASYRVLAAQFARKALAAHSREEKADFARMALNWKKLAEQAELRESGQQPLQRLRPALRQVTRR